MESVRGCLLVLLLIASATLVTGCEGRAQQEAIRNRIGFTAAGHSLPALEDYYAATVADKDHAWAVGTYGTILRITAKGRKVELEPSGTHASLLSVSANGPEDVLVGGENGLILHSVDGGEHWERAPMPKSVTDDIEAMARGADRKQIWAIGPEGTIIHSADDGRSWQDLGLHKDVTLNGVYFLDDRDGWITGEFGTILKTADGGHTWHDANHVAGLPKYVEDVTDEEAYHRGIPELEEGDLYLMQSAWETPAVGRIIGTGGFVLTTHDGGQTWQAERGDTRNTLFGIALPHGNPAVLVGILGTLVHQDGRGWSQDQTISNTTYTWLRSVSFSPDASLGVIAGGKGTILISQDGGASWHALDAKVIAASPSSNRNS